MFLIMFIKAGLFLRGMECVAPKLKIRKMPANAAHLIQRAIEQGYSLKEIGKKVGGVSRQRIYEYLRNTGQHELWKDQRSKAVHTVSLVTAADSVLQKDPLITGHSSFVTLLSNRLEQKVGNLEQKVTDGIASVTDIACAKAVRYWFPRRRAPLLKPLEVYVKTLDAYYTGIERNEKYSVMQLSEMGGLSFPHVGIFLKRVGGRPMYRSFTRQATSMDKKKAIYRGGELKMSHQDIAYFLNLPSYVVRTNPGYKARCVSKVEQLSYSCVGSNPTIIRRVPLRDVSQMYEAYDAGFSVAETVEFFREGKRCLYTKPQVRFFRRKRKKIEPSLVGVLRLFYNDPELEKPYRKNGF